MTFSLINPTFLTPYRSYGAASKILQQGMASDDVFCDGSSEFLVDKSYVSESVLQL